MTDDVCLRWVVDYCIELAHVSRDEILASAEIGVGTGTSTEASAETTLSSTEASGTDEVCWSVERVCCRDYSWLVCLCPLLFAFFCYRWRLFLQLASVPLSLLMSAPYCNFRLPTIGGRERKRWHRGLRHHVWLSRHGGRPLRRNRGHRCGRPAPGDGGRRDGPSGGGRGGWWRRRSCMA